MAGMKKMALFVILGLFISGCAVASKTVKPATTQETLPGSPSVSGRPAIPVIAKEGIPARKITYSQVTNLIEEFLDIKPTESVSGTPMFLGTSETNLVTLEIMGEKDNVSETSMKLIYPKDIETINVDLNNAMMIRFLKNVAPEFEEWPSRVKEMINKFSSMEAGKRDEENIILDEKIIQILYDKNVDSITVTIKHR